jgi:hypothetical protein
MLILGRWRRLTAVTAGALWYIERIGEYMSNYVLRNKVTLKHRHYLLLANQAGHWFNASPNRVKEYQAAYGDNFCLVLYRDGPNDDAYVISFRALKSLFVEENLVPGPKDALRWHGSIRAGQLELRGVSETVSVEQCHNAFNLLDE